MGYQIMTNPTITVHNLESGEIVTRDLTADELVTYEADKAASAARAAAIKINSENKTALLERLGINADEAAILLS